MATDAWSRVRVALGRSIPASSLALFRVAFGVIAAVSAARFVGNGWVDSLLVEPSFFFSWIPGLPVLPRWALLAVFGVQAISGLAFAAGAWVRRSRVAAILLGPVALGSWLASFLYIELIDKTFYLNHHVLFALLGGWLLCMPLAKIHLGGRVPAWTLLLVRAQVASVYFWAAIAKISPDWLFRGEPLTTWLESRGGLPILGPWLAWDPTAIAMSWGGLAYDLWVPVLLLWRPTRPLGVVLVLGFHLAVGLLFPIGIFPVLMVAAASLLLAPDWPGWLGLTRRVETESTRPDIDSRSWVKGAAALVAIAAIFAIPGRYLLFPGAVGWHERGHRFAWRVLVNEKTGFVEYRVVEPASQRVWRVAPSAELTAYQHEQMRTQPDMIREYALHLKSTHAKAGRQVEVYVDSFASLNGRPRQRFVRADVDITQSEAALWGQGWVVPLAP